MKRYSQKNKTKALTRLFIQFTLTGLIETKSSITSPIQTALRDALKITKNHNGSTMR